MSDGARSISVVAVAGSLFCVVLIYLALQIRAGNDPAIGAGHAPTAERARQVIVRRVIVRRILEVPASAPSAGGGGAPTVAPGGDAGAAPAPSAASAPAPAPAPAAAPAPAPVQTRAS